MNAVLAQTLLAFAAMLAGARLAGALAVRLRQPRIGGEMFAGLGVGAVLFSPWQTSASGSRHTAVVGLPVVRFVDVLGQIGVILYLCLVGLTLTPVDLRRNRRSIVIVSVPVVLGAVALAPLVANWFGGGRWQLAGGGLRRLGITRDHSVPASRGRGSALSFC